MQTNITGVYAIGDITGDGMLAYTGTEHAEIAVNHIVGNEVEKKEKAIVQILYISPECMQIGVSEDALKAEGKAYHKAELFMNYSGRFIINQSGLSPVAFVKLLVDYGCVSCL